MQTKTYFIHFICSILMCYTQFLSAQVGWEIIYPSPNAPNGDGIECVRQTPDGGYILAGLTGHNSAASRSRLVKVDDQGIIQWAQTYPLSSIASFINSIELVSGGYLVYGRLLGFNGGSGYSLYLQKLDYFGNQIWFQHFPIADVAIEFSLTSDGGTVLSSYRDGPNFQDTLVFIKTDSIGATQWIKRYPHIGSGGLQIPESITQTSTGDYVVFGRHTSRKSFLWKLDAQGDSVWLKTYGYHLAHPEYLGRIKETPDGGYVVAGNDAINTGETDVYIFKTDSAGTLQWEHRYGTPGNIVDYASDLDLTSDGGYIISGYRGYVLGNPPTVILMKCDALGNLIWERTFDGDQQQGHIWKSYSVQQTTDGGYIVGGAKITNSYTRENMYLIKTDSLGHIYDNLIQGYVYDDMDSSCTMGATELSFEGWTVRANGVKDFWTSTDSNGFYSMRVDTGQYEVVLYRPNPTYYEQAPCSNDSLQLYFPNFNTTTDTSFPQRATAYCPLMEVSLATPFLRRCFNSTYYVNYCNNGTIDADSVYIDVAFDPYLVVDTAALSSLPFAWSQLDSVTYRFDIDSVAMGDCGSFPITVYVDCDSTTLGQTHCSHAHIYPDSSCLAPWAGPFITVDAECMGDSVVFYLTNLGTNMGNSLQYFVYEDNVLVRPGMFSLNNLETETVKILAINNSTYRIEAQQPTGIPGILSDSLIAIAIEGCQDSINPGFVTQFPNYDGSPFIDLDCRENIGAYDPNDKQGFPKGYGPQHYIYDYTDLDYLIRFQNTGTDTAFNIVIRDTISPYLDISTLQPNVSSHAYTWRIFGENEQIVEFTFPNIMLVDSNANEPASHGFIQFSIQQQPNNPLGTVIENSAAIYFDFNPPIITNTTFHEIGDNFVQVQIISNQNKLKPTSIRTKIYPNPFSDIANITVEGYQNTSPLRLHIYDAMGREVAQQKSTNHQFQLNRNQLPAGIYYYRIQNAQQVIDSGKIIAR